MTLFAQITDLHIGFGGNDPDELNARRLDAVLARLTEGPDCPAFAVASGDLADHGDPASYARVAAAFARLHFPVHPLVGNHDDRATFAAAFPHVPRPDGFVQYVVEADGRRLVMLDTLEPGRHGGAFCEARAHWLADTLAAAPDVPTVIVMHHPPFDAGIAWMATDPAEPWVARFAEAIAGHRQIAAILCGHVHRAIVTPWQGNMVAICPSTAPQVALDLRPIDPARPDDRAMIVAEAPGYALHRWGADGLVSAFASAADAPVLARFDARMQPLVAKIAAERQAST